MDSTTTLEYVERIINHNDNRLIIHDLTNKTQTTQSFPNIRHVIALDDRLLIVTKMIPSGDTYHIVNKDFKVISTKHVEGDPAYVDAIALPKNKILIISDTTKTELSDVRYYVYSESMKLINHLSGTTITFFQINDELITFNKSYFHGLLCWGLNINDADSFRKKHYESLLKQLSDVTDFKCVDNSENFVLCAIGKTDDFNYYLKIVNSEGTVLFKPKIENFINYFWEFDPDKKELIFCSQYYQFYDDSCNYVFYRLSQQNQKWAITKPIIQKVPLQDMSLGYPSTHQMIITKNKIVITHCFNNVFDKETTNYLYKINSSTKPIYYDYYNSWFNTELERLIEMDVLKRLNKNLLMIILLYIS